MSSPHFNTPGRTPSTVGAAEMKNAMKRLLQTTSWRSAGPDISQKVVVVGDICATALIVRVAGRPACTKYYLSVEACIVLEIAETADGDDRVEFRVDHYFPRCLQEINKALVLDDLAAL